VFVSKSTAPHSPSTKVVLETEALHTQPLLLVHADLAALSAAEQNPVKSSPKITVPPRVLVKVLL